MIDDKLLNVLIPPFSIQALVENAVKHGIDKRKDGGLIEVIIQKENMFLKISVQNTGKLITGEQTGMGLNNLQERLHLQFNGTADFEIRELHEKVSATILIPMHE